MAGIHAARKVLGQPAVDFPAETAHGALAHYISSPEIKNFQPMNVNFGLIPPLGKRVRGKNSKTPCWQSVRWKRSPKCRNN